LEFILEEKNMKKTFITLFLMGAALAVYAQTGVIREMTGTVELKLAGTQTFIPAKSGDTLQRDTIISTGFKSTATIVVGSSTIVARPLTRLSLAEIASSGNTETININLQTGRLKVDVRPPSGTKANFTVKSPTATASVRGTSFELDPRNLTVLTGTVAYGGSEGAPALVSAGDESHTSENGKAADPVETSAQSLLPPAPPGAAEAGRAVPGGAASARYEQAQPAGGITINVNYN
jgi:hypothetical protein